MYKQNKRYLLILVLTQVLIGILIFATVVWMSRDITNHNSNILKMIAIADTKVHMKEMVENTIIRTDAKRKAASDGVSALLKLSVAQLSVPGHTIDAPLLRELSQQLGQTVYGPCIKILACDTNTGQAVLYQPGQDPFPADYDALKAEAALCEEYRSAGTKILLFARQQDMDALVKTQVHKEIHSAVYTQNEYIWVNEILNYDGGDNYAIRVIHPNLVDTEGSYLSTETPDLKGNYPYRKELAGIKERGELYQSYFFKNKSDGQLAEKFSYAKLYPPFNWVIATGKPTGDIFAYTDLLSAYDQRAANTALVVCFLIILSVFAGGLGIIILAQRKYRTQVETYVLTETELDPLTGAFSRKSAQEVLEDQLHKERTGAGGASLLILDIDNFKKINDTYGHNMGDLVLKKITQAILAVVRQSDQLFRWGGEEFLLLCPETDKKARQRIAEKVLQSVSCITFETQEQSFRVSVSVGGSAFCAEDLSVEQTVERADKALYRSKTTGKNKYTDCDELEPTEPCEEGAS